MCKGHRGVIGYTALISGVLIIMYLVLPRGFWWFGFALLLIVLGVRILRSR